MMLSELKVTICMFQDEIPVPPPAPPQKNIQKLKKGPPTNISDTKNIMYMRGTMFRNYRFQCVERCSASRF